MGKRDDADLKALMEMVKRRGSKHVREMVAEAARAVRPVSASAERKRRREEMIRSIALACLAEVKAQCRKGIYDRQRMISAIRKKTGCRACDAYEAMDGLWPAGMIDVELQFVESDYVNGGGFYSTEKQTLLPSPTGRSFWTAFASSSDTYGCDLAHALKFFPPSLMHARFGTNPYVLQDHMWAERENIAICKACTCRRATDADGTFFSLWDDTEWRWRTQSTQTEPECHPVRHSSVRLAYGIKWALSAGWVPLEK